MKSISRVTVSQQQQQQQASVERGPASRVHLLLARAPVTPGGGAPRIQPRPACVPQEPVTTHPAFAAVGKGGGGCHSSRE